MKQIAAFLLWWLLVWSLLWWCLDTFAFGADIPERERWEAQMVQYGKKHCETLLRTRQLSDVYYDAARVYYQIHEYTGDPTWLLCANQAGQIYQQYVVQAGGAKAVWVFPHGLYRRQARTCPPDAHSLQALTILMTKSAYASDITPLSWTKPARMSREVAYQLGNALLAMHLGINREARLQDMLEQALGHLEQWFVQNTGTTQIRPFMVALTAEALIAYQDERGDPRILPALKQAADWLWVHLWVPEAQAFRYSYFADADGGTTPTADLNLLIAPMFAWLYRQTGDTTYREWGDQIFTGGVKQAYLGSGKHFNQNYRWSIDYVRWRNMR